VINVMFNSCFDSIICHMCIFYFNDFFNCHFELFGQNCMKTIITG
jgi:hypothetical protein